MNKNFIEWSRDKVPENILGFARAMRSEPTEAEDVLWQKLRNRKLYNWKFRRQQHLEGFIVDFFCDQLKLIVEVDGEIHDQKEQQQFDQFRTKYLQEFGYKVIRFKNEEVLKNVSNVLKEISKSGQERSELIPSPLPLSPGRGVSEERVRGEGLKYFHFSSLLQREGWLSPSFIGVDKNGLIQYLSNQSPEGKEVEVVEGFALPGFQNAHSHAFQYAMAGLAENHPPGTSDDFWSWREEMYKCALAADPDQVEAIAAMLYAEMVRVGYTHVAEFHYLHHDKEEKPYAHLAEVGERLVAAAKTAG